MKTQDTENTATGEPWPNFGDAPECPKGFVPDYKLEAAHDEKRHYRTLWQTELNRADALAAHIERITGLCRDLDECELGSKEMADVWDTLENALQDTPLTSLRRRVLTKQANTIDHWADTLESLIQHTEHQHSKDPNYPAIGAEGMGEFAADMRDHATRLREQAEAQH